MSEDEKSPGMTIRIPAPRVLLPEGTRSLDPRTAEVLRALDRAKGTIVKTALPTSFPSAANLVRGSRLLVPSGRSTRGADYPRHPGTDPREPEPGKGRQGWEGQMIIHQPRRHRPSKSAGVLGRVK